MTGTAVQEATPTESYGNFGLAVPAESVSGRTKPGATELLFGCGASRHENQPGLAPDNQRKKWYVKRFQRIFGGLGE